MTPAEASSPTSCCRTMGALCWVLPPEEDEEALEEEVVEELEEVEEAAVRCCLSCQQPARGLVLVNCSTVL